FSERRNDQRQLARQKWHAQPTEPPVASGRCGDKLSKSVGAHSREGKAEEAHFSERRNDQRQLAPHKCREGKAEEAHFFSERRNDQRQLAPHKWHAQPTESPVASGRGRGQARPMRGQAV
ncbi:unnamed protein product, partial [Prorocentrum cordatum]